MRWARILQTLLVLVIVGGLGGWLLLFRPVGQPHSNDPAAVFNHGSIGNEETQGIPYWIWRVLPCHATVRVQFFAPPKTNRPHHIDIE